MLDGREEARSCWPQAPCNSSCVAGYCSVHYTVIVAGVGAVSVAVAGVAEAVFVAVVVVVVVVVVVAAAAAGTSVPYHRASPYRSDPAQYPRYSGLRTALQAQAVD